MGFLFSKEKVMIIPTNPDSQVSSINSISGYGN